MLKQAEDLLFAQFLNNNQKTMEHFQKARSFSAVKMFKHLLHEYKSWDAWISMQSIDLLRSRGERRVISSRETYVFEPFIFYKMGYLRNHLKSKFRKRPKVAFKCSNIQESCFIFLKFKKPHGSEKSKNTKLIEACQAFTYIKYNKLSTLYGFVLMQIYVHLCKII